MDNRVALKRKRQNRVIKAVVDGITPRQAAQDQGLGTSTLLRWLAEDEDFKKRYFAARVEQAHALADEALRIAREPLEERDAPLRNVELKKQELLIDTLKWMCAKIAPRHYGTHVFDEHKMTGGVVVLPAIRQTIPPPPPFAEVQQPRWPGIMAALPGGTDASNPLPPAATANGHGN